MRLISKSAEYLTLTCVFLFFSQVTEENGSERWSRLKCFDFDNYDQKKKNGSQEKTKYWNVSLILETRIRSLKQRLKQPQIFNFHV